MFSPSSPDTAQAAKITVILTNWKRPENVLQILDTLTAQTIRPDVWLWNNGEPMSHPAIRVQINASDNLLCWPRWLLASMAQTEHVCILDDDLVFTDDNVLQDLVSVLATKPPDTIVGLFGVNLDAAKPYRGGEQVWPSSDTDQPADLIKGRCMVLRTDALRAVRFHPRPERHVLMGDDILVSGALAGGKPRMHLVPAGFKDRYRELPNQHSLFREQGHWEHRERARREAFPF